MRALSQEGRDPEPLEEYRYYCSMKDNQRVQDLLALFSPLVDEAAAAKGAE
jgi:hypothetical protein